jgi:hypothetical protein
LSFRFLDQDLSFPVGQATQQEFRSIPCKAKAILSP